MSEIATFLNDARARVDAVLARWAEIVEVDPGGAVGEAIAYSLRGNGKRLRPALLLAAFQETGGQGVATELAAAVEVVHTYSLVHDDLPCMDDDALRRGRATTHRVYGVEVAMVAGFKMVPLAASILSAGAQRLDLDPAETRRVARILFRAAGVDGMIGGQVMDLEAEGRSPDLPGLMAVHRAKTGALITASAVMGAVAARAGRATERAVEQYADEVGLAFQIVDDVLDATATTEELGKTAGKDARQRKASYSTLLGALAAREAARAEVGRAIDHLGRGGIDSTLLRGFAHRIVDRSY